MSRVSPLRATVATGLTLGTAALGLALAPAALAADALPQPRIEAATVEVGDTITVTGTGCRAPAGALHPTDVYYTGPNSNFDGWTQAEADGSWTLDIEMYEEITPGTYPLEINCDYYLAGGGYPQVTVTVVADGDLARTTPPVGTLRGTQANTPGVTITSTDSTTRKPAVGEKVVRVLTGFQPREWVTVTLHSTPQTVGRFRADDNGVVTVSFTIPAGTTGTAHDLVFDGDAGTYYQEAITLDTAGSSSGTLAYTGASVGLPLALGTGLLAVGGGALVLARRRSAGAPQV
jgi:hypothetical protein